MRKKTRIAVIGAAGWGLNLVRVFTQLKTLEQVCEADEETRAQLAKSYPKLSTTDDLPGVLENKNVHAVAIAGPIEARADLTRRALEAGKHVLVEKPLACADAIGRELVALADEKGLVLMVDHLLCYHPAFVKLTRLVSDGALGTVRYIHANRTNGGHFRKEEHPYYGFAPNDLAMILTLAEEAPNTVSVNGGLHRGVVAEVTHTHLGFPSGLLALLHFSWLHPFRRQELVVVGSNQTAVFDDTRPWDEKLLLYRSESTTQIPTEAKAEPTPVILEGAEPLRLACEHFLACIIGKERCRTGGNMIIGVLKTLNAALRSLPARGAPQKVPAVAFKIPPKQEPSPDAVLEPSNEAAYFVHPTSVIDEGVVIGIGSKIWHFCHMMTGTRLGERANIGQNVVIGPDVTIGNNCKIQNNVSIFSGVTLEDDVFCGPSMVFTNVRDPRSAIPRKDQIAPTLVKKGATIGANATIVCGNAIGTYAFVGAGSVVTKDVPAHALVYGNPAEFEDWVCSCGHRLSKKLVCRECGKVYFKDGSGLSEGMAKAQPAKPGTTRKKKI